MPSEKQGTDTDHRLVPFACILNRPYCWQYGHELSGFDFGKCNRCGKRRSIATDGYLIALLIVVMLPLMALHEKWRQLKAWVNNAEM